MDIPIKESGNRRIVYSDTAKHFALHIDGKLEKVADKQQDLEDYIKKLDKKQFVRIKVIKNTSFNSEYGEITSFNRELNEAWIVLADGDREKMSLRYTNQVYLDTPANHAIAEQVRQIHAEVKSLNEKRNELQKQLTDCVTADYLRSL